MPRFKDYYESKRKLLLACDASTPKAERKYKLTKYCKFPVHMAEGDTPSEKVHISFKPKDTLIIMWEVLTEGADAYPIAKYFKIVDVNGVETTVYPHWNNNKIHSWVEKNTYST